MKVLSMTLPWALVVPLQAKLWETRSWNTSYRGPLLVHAAKAWPRADQDMVFDHDADEYFPFWDVLVRQHGYTLSAMHAMRGHIIGMCTLVDTQRTEAVRDHLSEYERAFGNYGNKRFAWSVPHGRLLPTPIPARGALGLWTFDHPALDALATVDDASMA